MKYIVTLQDGPRDGNHPKKVKVTVEASTLAEATDKAKAVNPLNFDRPCWTDWKVG